MPNDAAPMSLEQMGQIALLYAKKDALDRALQNGGRRPNMEELKILAFNLAEEFDIPEVRAMEFLKHIHRY